MNNSQQQQAQQFVPPPVSQSVPLTPTSDEVGQVAQLGYN
jgi:hypothetical protein